MVEKQMKFMKLEIHVHPKKNWGYMFKKVHFSGGLLQLNLPRKKQKLRVQLRCASEKGRETKTSDEKSHKSHHKTEIWKPQKLVFDSNLQPLSEEITQNVTTMHKSFGWLAWKKTLGLKLGRSCPTVCPSTFRPWRCASPTNGGKDNGL